MSMETPLVAVSQRRLSQQASRQSPTKFRLPHWAAFLRHFRLQDFVWTLFVTVLILVNEINYDAAILLVLIGAFQVVEPRLKPFRTAKGQVASLGLKLVLCYLLVGYTHTIFSPYHSIYLLPVVSAALSLELPGVLAVTAISCLSYFSFLLPIYIDWSTFELPPGYLGIMALRAAFFAIIAFLIYEQARAKRDEMERTRESNRNLRRAEVSLRRSERLAALGQLTAGLAHELRNPLGTIRASSEMIAKLEPSSKGDVMHEMAGYIRSEADRMNGLISHFLDFARPLQIHPSEHDLVPVVQNVVREQSELAQTRQVAIETSVPAQLQFVFDADLLRVALSNLLQNAIQACGENGKAQIIASALDGQVTILVKDNGQGIAPEHLESIFNPFFTTKSQGTGLGLAIVAKIIDEHGGRIRTQSSVGVGTKFEMLLPMEQPR
jgi:two-component system, NtrC family, sensor histidine kinase HydH